MPMNMIKPPKVQPGDKIAVVSLSWGGPGTFPHRYQVGKEQLEAEFGVTVVAMPHALADPGWLARNPKARAADLMAAFADPSIKAIVASIAGEDSIRTLPYTDLDVIRANPKIFMGFSDTTITHFACLKAGLVSFYGPAIMAGFGENGGLFPYMVDSVRRTLFSAAPIGPILPNQDGWTVEFLDWAEPANQNRKRALQPSPGWRWLQGAGSQRGHLIGGCIEVLDFLRGTEFWPSRAQWRNALLFLETSEAAPSPAAVVRYLRTLAAVGVLPLLAGLLFARPGGQVAPEKFTEYDQALLQVIVEENGLTALPIITGMDFGHTDPMFVLPLGVQAEVDCAQRRFTILENGVVDPV
uniref:Muramoyltetrapeptide carboxypeptidase n=1 Tax=uncultured bacterium A1Q1_fos_485 TaxID=1256576 RepID=L7W071_9BACT|nr:muramoyltetrapeptide carboxypeptidase [uncultured bacterium A1Q1_fos_485]